MEGLLTRDNLIKGHQPAGNGLDRGRGHDRSVPTVTPELGFQEALERLRSSGLPALPVVDAGGRLVGLLTHGQHHGPAAGEGRGAAAPPQDRGTAPFRGT